MRRQLLFGVARGRRLFIKLLPFLLFMGLGFGAVVLRWSTVEGARSFQIGRPAPMTYYALTDASFQDDRGTQQLRERVKDGILGVVLRGAPTSDVLKARYDRMLNSPDRADFLSEPLRGLLASLSFDDRESLLATVRSINEDLLRSRYLTPEQKDSLIWNRMENLETDPSKANLAFQLLLALTENNEQVSAVMTEQVKNLAADAVQPVFRRISAGETIARKGEVITESLAGVLRAQGYQEGRFSWPQLVLALLVSALLPLWIQAIDGTNRRYDGNGLQGGWIFVLALTALSWYGEVIGLWWGVFALGSVPLVAFLYLTQNRGVAFLLSLALGLTGSLVTLGTGAGLFTISVLGFFVAALMGRLIFQGRFTRTLLFAKTFALGLGVTLLVWLLQWGLLGQFSLANLMAPAWCLLWAALTVILLPIFETAFDLLSPLRLMELTHPTHPLLRRLLIEAPGTYHHTQMVGNLAEAVAERLGLNPLLIRAGASFHDIGKLGRPAYFIENQLSGVNPHDSLTPTMSAMVIINHVKEGLEIAEEYRLPRRIRDFIPEHHGTTCLTYFMRKAQAEGQSPIESQFCYPGPKPRTKETAVLMIADSVEASARSVSLTKCLSRAGIWL